MRSNPTRSLLALFAGIIGALSIGPASAEAFSFTQVHSLWQEPAHIQTAAPLFVGPVLPGFGPIAFFSNPVPGSYPSNEAMCESFAAAQGLTAADDFYCVYDATLFSTTFGTPCFGTPCSPGTGTVNLYSGVIKLYQATAVQTVPYTTLATQLQTAWNTWWADLLANIANPLYTAPPPPTSPVVCRNSEPYRFLIMNPGEQLGFWPAGSQAADQCSIYRNAGAPAAPTASISASPSTIIAGGSSSLTYSCSASATSATISGIGPVTLPSGTRSVSPGSTTTYTLTCSNAGGNGTADATVTVVPALTASCSVSPTSVTVGQTATWTASAGGGTGVYAYSWSGTDSLTGSTASVGRTYTTTGTKTASVTVTSGTQSVTVACANSLTVNPAAAADLTAGLVTPTTAIAGQATPFFATATNSGTAGTGGAFPILFQIQGGALAQSGNIGPVAAGASEQGSANLTFPSAGSYQVRACANFTTGWATVVSESNTSNNCGPWTTVTVSNPAPTGVLSCAVSNTNPPPNTSVTYTVTPSNGATGPYTWNDTQGGSYGSGASVNRLIPGAGPYVMFVSGQNVASQPVACPAVSGTCPNPTATISASPTRVREGETATITWSASGVDTSCTITGPGVSQTIPGGSCVIPNGSATPVVTTQSVYRITCDGGESSAEAIVNVIPRFTEF